MVDDDDVPSAIRDAFHRACEALAPVDDAILTWGFLVDEAALGELRARLDAQLARDRNRLAAQLVAYRHGELSAEAFRAWVATELTADQIIARAWAADLPAGRRPVKRCACGRRFAAESWSRLPLVATIDNGLNVGELLELRTCSRCGSTISLPIGEDAPPSE